MPTPELKALLLEELTIQHDIQKLCLKWDIDFNTVDSYGLLSFSSQNPVPDSKVDLYTQPSGYNKPRVRTSNRIDFG